MIDSYSILKNTQRQRVSDGDTLDLFNGCELANPSLILIWSQLGDFDSLEYALVIKRNLEKLTAQGINIRAIGIGDRESGQKFCEYTGFPQEWLFIDLDAAIHQKLELYPGLSTKVPLLSAGQNAWLNLMLMCAGVGSPGTLSEVFRGYLGDRQAPQLIANDEVIQNTPLPPIKGSFFKFAGGEGFQRPFELATVRLQNMTEVLSNWQTYVPNTAYLTQRGATFLFNSEGKLLYEHRDRAILGFAENMSDPLSFLNIINSDYSP